jgi:hypothetical protein
MMTKRKEVKRDNKVGLGGKEWMNGRFGEICGFTNNKQTVGTTPDCIELTPRSE